MSSVKQLTSAVSDNYTPIDKKNLVVSSLTRQFLPGKLQHGAKKDQLSCLLTYLAEMLMSYTTTYLD